jgi:hypothetical protein
MSTTGKQLLSAAWSGLKQDKELMVIPVLGGLLASLSVATITCIGFLAGAFDSLFSNTSTSGNSNSSISPLGYAFAALIAYVTTLIAIYFQAALISGAMQRLQGGDPTLRSSLSAAKNKLGAILIWALIVTTVGLVLRAISDRGGVLARLGSLVAGIAWSVATFFVLPVVIFEGLGSFEAVKRSGGLISARWGTVARTSIRFGLKFLMAVVLAMGAIVFGIYMAVGNLDSSSSSASLLGLVILFLGIFGLVVISVISNSLSGYVRTVLYLHAVGKPVPGISNEILGGAFPLKS